MKLYMAPLEGITTFPYRNAFNSIFGSDVDKFFAPFIVPHIKRDMYRKEERDLLPENNKGLKLIPQVLTDKGEDLLRYEQIMHDLGYPEININIGCPSGTVSSKGRGAGFLGRKEELDAFLEKVYSKNTGPVSIKTRTGIDDNEEFYEILEIYNKYPVSELIVHPRTLKQYYRGTADRETFLYALEHSVNPVVYNGDIFGPEDVEELKMTAVQKGISKRFDIMIGRGVITDPGLFRKISGGEPASAGEIRDLISGTEWGYLSFSQADQTLYRMKEIWTYLGAHFDNEKLLKKIKKSKSLDEMHVYTEELLESGILF